MSRYRQPKNLEILALNRLGDWIARIAEIQMAPISALAQQDTSTAQSTLSNIVDSIRTHLEYNVPWMLHDKLVTVAIQALSTLIDNTKHNLGFRGSMGKFVSQINVVVRMTEALLTKYVTIISIDTIPKMMRTVFYSKMNFLTGLIYLNLGSLSGGWKTADMEGSIVDSIKHLHRLKYLCINYDCTDTILKCLVENCQLLEKLDVSCSKCVTNESIDIIVKLKGLKQIQLYRTFVTWEGYARLLIKSKYLEDIGRCDDIGKVLEFIDLTNSEAAPFHLKTYVSRYAPSNHLQLAVEMCPFIRNMTVFHNTLQGDLLSLISLGDLCELKLLSCDFYADQIKQVLLVKGSNLTSLHLEHVDQIDLNALMYISQMCPLLESLTLYNCSLIQHTSLYTKKLEILPFRNLKKLTCVATCTHDQLSFLLSNCINIEFIHMGTAVELTDDFIHNIFNKNPFLNLKELRIMQSDILSMTSVEKIINNCTSLETFVELESWSLLTDSDREYIRNYIKLNNFNIDTNPIRRYDV